MKEIDMNSLLGQLRANSAATQGQLNPIEGVASGTENQDFSKLLQSSIDKVNDLQKHSSDLGVAFELGDSKVSLAEVMLARQKSGVAFQSVLQVRNKLISAYKDVMSMSV